MSLIIINEIFTVLPRLTVALLTVPRCGCDPCAKLYFN